LQAAAAAAAAATEARLCEDARALQHQLAELEHERDDLHKLCQGAVTKATAFATGAITSAFVAAGAVQAEARRPSAAVVRLTEQLDQAHHAARQVAAARILPAADGEAAALREARLTHALTQRDAQLHAAEGRLVAAAAAAAPATTVALRAELESSKEAWQYVV
jgi:hypothetical protein